MNGSECHSVNANECECECVCTLRLKVLSSPCSRRELVDFRYKVVGVVVVVDTYLRNQTTKIVEMKRTNNRTRAKVNVSSQRFIVVSVANKTNRVWKKLASVFSSFSSFIFCRSLLIFLRNLPEFALSPSPLSNDYKICFAHFFILMNSKNTRYTRFSFLSSSKNWAVQTLIWLWIMKGTNKKNELSTRRFSLISLNGLSIFNSSMTNK